MAAVKHGNEAHGCYSKNATLQQKRTQACWRNMLNRCSKPLCKAYKNYGARGITVCVRWLFLENFIADMGLKPEGLTLERSNNEKGYSKSNCRWATWVEQNRNKRKRSDNTTGVEGVVFRKNRGTFVATIIDDAGRPRYLGSSPSLEQAAQFRKDAEKQYSYGGVQCQP